MAGKRTSCRLSAEVIGRADVQHAFHTKRSLEASLTRAISKHMDEIFHRYPCVGVRDVQGPITNLRVSKEVVNVQLASARSGEGSTIQCLCFFLVVLVPYFQVLYGPKRF